MPQRLATSDGLVFTEDHMFCLCGDGGPDSADERAGSLTPPVTVGSGLGLVTFHSELEDNEPQVDLEYWSAQPPEPDGPWEVSARDRLTVTGDRLTLASGVSMHEAPHELAIPPGGYHIGVWCTGRAESRARELAAIEAGTQLQGVEKWLIRLWPVIPRQAG